MAMSHEQPVRNEEDDDRRYLSPPLRIEKDQRRNQVANGDPRQHARDADVGQVEVGKTSKKESQRKYQNGAAQHV